MTDKQAYHLFQKQNTLPVYLEEWYLDLSCEDGEWKCCYAVDDGVVLGLFIYYIKKKLSLTYITMPTLVKYMGPIFADHVKDQEKQQLLDRMSLMLPKTSYFIQQWSPKSLLDLSNELIQAEFKARDTFFWDIAPSDDVLLGNMNGNYRRAIRKYQDDIQQVRAIQNEGESSKTTTEDVKRFVKLLEDGMGSLADHAIGELQLTNLIHELEARERGKLLMLEYDGELVGASLTCWDEDTAYYLFAGNNKEQNKKYPGVQTAWKTQQYLKANTSVKTLDFLGSSIESIAKIWTKLGAEKGCYPLVEKTTNPLFTILNKSKNLWRNK